jgi:hypothetical protein
MTNGRAAGMMFAPSENSLGIKGNGTILRLFLLTVFASMALFGNAEKRMTVTQLEQTLLAASAAHKLDADIVRQIGAVELTERLTEITLEQLDSKLHPNSQVSLALRLLADQSAFLNPPTSELPTLAAPDDVSRQRILEQARIYVAQMLPRLPNFLATRTTNRYDDSPQALQKGAWPVRGGLHLVGTESREASVLEERDNRSPNKGSAFWQSQMGLVSGGEFGTTLAMIMADTMKGKVTWDHWEQTEVGPVAVFHYSVPKSASHYEVIGSFQREAAPRAIDTPRGGGTGFDPSGASINRSNTSILRNKPGYHGSLWLDPATGTVLRVTIESDPKESAPFRSATILVEYGPVQISGSRFICPVRSVAISVAVPDSQTPFGDDDPTHWLNETLFTQYRLFGSTIRILPDVAAPLPGEISH